MKANFIQTDLLDGSETYVDCVAHRKDLPPGTVHWYRTNADGGKCADGEIRVMYFTCPCGCGQVGACPVRGIGWTWNKSLEKPTLAPSILLPSGCRWHGYLTDGEFRQC